MASVKIAFKYMEKIVMKVFIPHLKPKFEYASPIYSSNTRMYTEMPGKVQQQATRTVPQPRDLSNGKIVTTLDLPTSDDRGSTGTSIQLTHIKRQRFKGEILPAYPHQMTEV